MTGLNINSNNMDEFKEHMIPNRIRQIRKSLNLTLGELAEIHHAKYIIGTNR